ncbi:MAG: helix-hairpin-helix domain-containing protein [Myxococcales bacterium]|nr:helix-hairpin-helix domain-containing protein [Myxococcales bacterium]
MSAPRDGALRAAALFVALAASVSLARAELLRVDAPPPEMPAPLGETSAPLRERGKIDLNAADEGTLTLLPRVGPALARRIVAHREARGGFSGVEDLLEVKGIGPKTLERLRPMIEVSESIPEIGEAEARAEGDPTRTVDAAEGHGEEAELGPE